MRRLSALGVVLALAGCAGPAAEQSRQAPVEQRPSGGSESATTAAPADEAAATSAPSTSAPPSGAVPAALDFSLPGVTGGQVVGAELAGKDVVLWFWAPW